MRQIPRISQFALAAAHAGAPRKIEFSLKLTRVDDEQDLMGQATSKLLSLLNLK